MSSRFRAVSLLALLGLAPAAELLACGDKFLVAGRGTRYQRPKSARAANVLIYADPASGLADTLDSVPVDSLLKREGHKATRATTLDELGALLTGGGFDVILVANSVVAAVEQVVSGTADKPELVAFCVKPASKAATDTKDCGVKAPPRERSLLEAIDKAVLRHDKNVRKAAARG